METDIQKNIAALKTRIHVLEEKYHRPAGSVCLLAVSKKQSIEKMQQALAAGQHLFAENYLQEALPKMMALAKENIEWHFIGPIQSNKTKKIAENFMWVHSVSSLTVAQRLNNQRPTHLPPLNVCIQVNISGEKTKSGITDEQLLPFAKALLALPHLKLRGLMTIPAVKQNLLAQRSELQKLSRAFKKLCEQDIPLDTLSMGMSNDLEAGIAEGATIVRIGTGIFGGR